MKMNIRISAPHQHVTQVFDRSYSKDQLGICRISLNREEADEGDADEADDGKTDSDPVTIKRGLRDVHATLCREARRYSPGRVLAVCQFDVEKLLPGIGPLPGNLEVAHHNAVAGKDLWADVAAVIVVGRTAPSPAAVERMAESLTGAAIPHITGWYPKADAVREMADGTFLPAETDQHPNPIAEACRWSICERELVQIIGRARGVNRTPASPVDIILMVNTPLPVPVERLISASDLDPTPDDLMFAAGGVAFTNPTDAAATYPNLWATRNAAKHAFERAPEPRLAPNPNPMGDPPALPGRQ
jgi:putative DNA primase/helicase